MYNILTIVLSIINKTIIYSAFPFIFSTLRKKEITQNALAIVSLFSTTVISVLAMNNAGYDYSTHRMYAYLVIGSLFALPGFFLGRHELISNGLLVDSKDSKDLKKSNASNDIDNYGDIGYDPDVAEKALRTEEEKKAATRRTPTLEETLRELEYLNSTITPTLDETPKEMENTQTHEQHLYTQQPHDPQPYYYPIIPKGYTKTRNAVILLLVLIIATVGLSYFGLNAYFNKKWDDERNHYMENAYDEGYRDGKSLAYSKKSEFEDKAYSNGYREGFTDGSDEGYAQGYEEGYAQGCEDMQ